MARDQHKMMLPQNEWVELTNADTATVTFQCLSGEIEVRGAPDTTLPGDDDHGLIYLNGAGELGMSMNVLFSRGDCLRLFARGVTFQAEVLIDHG